MFVCTEQPFRVCVCVCAPCYQTALALMTHHTKQRFIRLKPTSSPLKNKRIKQHFISSPKVQNVFSFLIPCSHRIISDTMTQPQCIISNQHNKTALCHQLWQPARQERKKMVLIALRCRCLTCRALRLSDKYEDISMHHSTATLLVYTMAIHYV